MSKNIHQEAPVTEPVAESNSVITSLRVLATRAVVRVTGSVKSVWAATMLRLRSFRRWFSREARAERKRIRALTPKRSLRSKIALPPLWVAEKATRFVGGVGLAVTTVSVAAVTLASLGVLAVGLTAISGLDWMFAKSYRATTVELYKRMDFYPTAEEASEVFSPSNLEDIEIASAEQIGADWTDLGSKLEQRFTYANENGTVEEASELFGELGAYNVWREAFRVNGFADLHAALKRVKAEAKKFGYDVDAAERGFNAHERTAHAAESMGIVAKVYSL